jgi:hypothetical protein
MSATDPVPSALRVVADHVLHTFLDLMEDDTNWRNKLLKVLQYTARLLAWYYAFSASRPYLPKLEGMVQAHCASDGRQAVYCAGAMGGLLPPSARAKAASKMLSTSRRVMILGDSLVDARTLLREAVTAIRTRHWTHQGEQAPHRGLTIKGGRRDWAVC